MNIRLLLQTKLLFNHVNKDLIVFILNRFWSWFLAPQNEPIAFYPRESTYRNTPFWIYWLSKDFFFFLKKYQTPLEWPPYNNGHFTSAKGLRLLKCSTEARKWNLSTFKLCNGKLFVMWFTSSNENPAFPAVFCSSAVSLNTSTNTTNCLWIMPRCINVILNWQMM